MGKIEMIPCMEYTENNMTERFCKGDIVYCRTEDRECLGKILDIGLMSEEDGEKVIMVVIDTSSGKWSRSYEYVKPEDIVFMRRVTLDEEQAEDEKIEEEKPRSLMESMRWSYGRDGNYRDALMDGVLGIRK